MEVTPAADPENSVPAHHDDAVLARFGAGTVNQSGSFKDKKPLANKHFGRFTARGTSQGKCESTRNNWSVQQSCCS